jgi:hypothetical protein
MFLVGQLHASNMPLTAASDTFAEIKTLPVPLSQSGEGFTELVDRIASNQSDQTGNTSNRPPRSLSVFVNNAVAA